MAKSLLKSPLHMKRLMNLSLFSGSRYEKGELSSRIGEKELGKGNENHWANASARVEENNDIVPGVVIPCQKVVPSEDDDAQVNSSDKATGANESALEPPAITRNVCGENVEANEFIAGSCQDNVDIDTSKYNDLHGEIIVISSDSDNDSDTDSDNIITKPETRKEQPVCVVCQGAEGNSLSRRCQSCHVIVHVKCLTSAVGLDLEENFYCPFCAYLQSVLRCQESKRKFSLAMEGLMTFLESGDDLTETSSSKRSSRSKGD